MHLKMCTTRNKRMRTIKTQDIRRSFLDYFIKNGHKELPSSPVIPFDDPTILFINAGMNQFKDVYTGKRKLDTKRATTVQKCIRAGGKHNDLDNVGFTTRHHTFFEMLGNFSFGDYYKEEAIYYAWEWITKELRLPKDKLYVSIYETDDEAFELWGKIAPELKNGRILRFGKKDNFWSMGNIGPCGPNSEIHFDRGEKYGTGPEDKVNGETDRFVEIWNLVFMQYDQTPDGIIDLPNRSVDTGAGLERIAAIMQNVDSNYNIDLFQNIIAAIAEITKSKYEGDLKPSFHVVADHLRALTFAITDGAGISNEGQGYVLRRILRRAVRHGRLLGADEPFIYKLIPTLVNEMGEAYPEIKEQQSHVANVVRIEEESFDRTLDKGLVLFERIVSELDSKIIPGDAIFKLYDTYGFPYDLTEIMASEKGLTLDKDGFNKTMESQKEQSRLAQSVNLVQSPVTTLKNDVEFANHNFEPTYFDRGKLSINSSLLYAYPLDTSDNNKLLVALILDKTPFYVKSGGQENDLGKIIHSSFEVNIQNLHTYQDYIIHECVITKGDLNNIELAYKEKQSVLATVDAHRRMAIQRNHTVTHLTHTALRKVLGPHIKQSGSYVGADRMRFDFSHHQPMTDKEIQEVEMIVNNEILKSVPVSTDIMNLEQAKATGAMALFGEKYDADVRVVSVGEFSKELCGGTHVENSSQIGPFFITLETGIASGVRRIEAITGTEAVTYMMDAKSFRKRVASIVNRPEADSLGGVEHLKEQNSLLQKELKKVKAEMFSGGGSSVGKDTLVNDITFSTHYFDETDRDIMTSWIDSKKEMASPVFAVALGLVGGKMTYIAAASSQAVEKNIHIGKITKELLPKFGGRGGGKPNFAQGSVENDTEPSKLFDTAKSFITVE